MQWVLGNRSILGTADMAKTLPYPAEMDRYLQFDTVKNSVRKFTVWHTKVQLKLMGIKKKGADVLIEWPT